MLVFHDYIARWLSEAIRAQNGLLLVALYTSAQYLLHHILAFLDVNFPRLLKTPSISLPWLHEGFMELLERRQAKRTVQTGTFIH